MAFFLIELALSIDNAEWITVLIKLFNIALPKQINSLEADI